MFRGTDVLKNPATTTTPVVSGPFTLGEWVRGDHLASVKNPNYWRKGKPYLDRLVIKVMPNSAARILALQAGEIDFIDEYYFPLSSYKLFASDKRFEVHDVSYPSDDVMIINTRNAPLDKKEVRQALLIALDRNYIHKNVFYDTGSVGRSAVDTRIPWAYDPAVDYEKMYAYDPERAAKLLDEAGLKPGGDGVRFRSASPSIPDGRNTLPWPGHPAILLGDRRQGRARRRGTSGGAEARLCRLRFRRDLAELHDFRRSGARHLAGLHDRVDQQERDLQQCERLLEPRRSTSSSPRAATRRRRPSAPAITFKVQGILARDLPTLTIHQQAEIDAASAKLKGLWHGANYMWWDDVWLEP